MGFLRSLRSLRSLGSLTTLVTYCCLLGFFVGTAGLLPAEEGVEGAVVGGEVEL